MDNLENQNHILRTDSSRSNTTACISSESITASNSRKSVQWDASLRSKESSAPIRRMRVVELLSEYASWFKLEPLQQEVPQQGNASTQSHWERAMDRGFCATMDSIDAVFSTLDGIPPQQISGSTPSTLGTTMMMTTTSICGRVRIENHMLAATTVITENILT
jgi:hypothetical protein